MDADLVVPNPGPDPTAPDGQTLPADPVVRTCAKCRGNGEVKAGRVDGGMSFGNVGGEFGSMYSSGRTMYAVCDLCRGSGHLDQDGNPAERPAPVHSTGGPSVIGTLLVMILIIIGALVVLTNPGLLASVLG